MFSARAIDGDAVYVLGSDGDLACLDAAKGAVRWQKNLAVDFEGSSGMWAYAESPLIDGDVLICTPGGDTATLVALNKTNGEAIWKAAVPGKAMGEGLKSNEASPDAYKELGRFDQPQRSAKNAWPHPVIAGGRLYLRDQNVLLCYDEKPEKP